MKKLLLLLSLMTYCCFAVTAEHLQACDADNVANGASRVWLNEINGSIKFVELEEPTFVHPDRMEIWLKNLLKTNNQTGFVLYETRPDKLGYTHFRFRQTHNGYPVNNAVYYIHTFEGKIVSANGEFYPDIELDVNPLITIEGAIAIGKDHIHGHQWAWPDDQFPTPTVEVGLGKDGYHLAYKTDIYAIEPLNRKFLMIDVLTGEVIAEYNRIHTNSVAGEVHCKYHGVQTATVDSISPNEFRLRDYSRGGGIETYDMNAEADYSAAVDFIDSDNVWTSTINQDDAALDAHWGTGGMYDYMLNVHGYNSYDGNGAPILSYVHYSNNYTNAFWDGEKVVYGDGDGVDWQPLTSTEVVGHEVMHGFTEKTASLVYANESGALNESYSDCFGVILDFRLNPTTANYIMGDDFMLISSGLRNLGNPKQYNHPDTYLGEYWNSGGVHNQSGIQNYWFYLLTQGGEGTNDNNDDYIVDPIPMADAADVLFRSLSVYLTPNSTYADARFFGIQSATELFGECTQQLVSVTNAWHAVGVGALFNNEVHANFVASNTSNCQVPTNVKFTNTSTNGSSYIWDFGNGLTSTSTNPVAIYDMPGTYTVSLTTTGNSLCANTDTRTIVDYITVTDEEGPALALCYPITNVAVPSNGIFNFTFETINNSTPGSLESYQDYTCTYSTDVTEGLLYPFSVLTGSNENIRIWIDANNDGIFNNFNELVYTSFSPVQLHTGLLVIPGTDLHGVPLRLRIKSDVEGNDIFNSCAPVISGQAEDYTIIVSENVQGPDVDFTADQTSVLVGEEVHFSDLTQNVPEAWFWEFPGGTPSNSSAQNPTVSYSAVGSYPVTLTAVNNLGEDTAIKTNYINVVSLVNMCTDSISASAAGIFYDSGGPEGNYSPYESCTFLIDPGCAVDLTMIFTEFDVEPSFDQLFAYDGVNAAAPLIGIYSGENSPDTIISTSGKLFFVFESDEILSYSGWEGTWSASLGTETPIAEFAISDTNPPFNVPVYFTDQSTDFPSSWLWDFGDGFFSTEKNPTHFYSNPGTYEVELIVGNCFDSDAISYALTVQDSASFQTDPTSIYEFVNCGDSTEVILKIQNTGQGDLVYAANVVGSSEFETSYMTFNLTNNYTEHTFTNVSAFTDSIFLEIILVGDYDNVNEFASLYIDGDYILSIDDGNPPSGTEIIKHYAFGGPEVSNWAADGNVVIWLINSSAVGFVWQSAHTVNYEVKVKSPWLSAGPLSGIVSGSSDAPITIPLNSLELPAGVYTDEIEIITNDPINPVRVVPITLEIIGEAEISFSESCLTFPTTMQHVTASLEVVVANNGCETLMISNIFSDDLAYNASVAQLSIPPHSLDTITVFFTPSTVGDFPSMLNFSGNIETTTLCLAGTSFGAPIVNVDESMIDLSLNCGDSTSVDLILSNEGLSDLIYRGVLVGEDIVESSQLAYDETNNNTTHVFNNILPGVDSIFLEITLNGDFDNSTEFASLYIDGNYLFQIEDLDQANGSDIIINYAFGGANVANWASDGVVEVYIENTPTVNNIITATNEHRVVIRRNGSSWVNLNSIEETIAPSLSDTITINFNSTGLAAGVHTNVLEIRTNDPLIPILTIPISLEVQGVPAIDFSVSCVDFPPAMQYSFTTVDLEVINNGCEILEIYDIYADSPEYAVTAPPLTVAPFSSVIIPVVFHPVTIGDFLSNLNIVSNVSNTSICVSASSFGAPSIEVNPSSINIDMVGCNDEVMVPISISNVAFDSLIFSFEGTGIIGGTSLDSVRARLNANYSSLTDLMDNFYEFSNGIFGTSIIDGGNNMYDGGNLLSVDNSPSLEYFNSSIVSNAYLGPSGQYFTRKYPGLFVFAADANEINKFSIDGNLGADGLGTVSGTVLDVNHAGLDYKGFVKRVYDFGGPSINHLVIMRDNGSLVQTIPSSTSTDEHTIEGMNGVARMYYLLFAEANSGFYSDAQMEAIMIKFLEITEVGAYVVLPSGAFELAGGSSQNFDLFFNTDNTPGGTYSYAATINSNDPLMESLEIPVTINVNYDLCADYTYDLLSDCGGQVAFFAEIVNSATSYLWDFGDGNTSIDNNPTYIYQTPGDYLVSLTVENLSSSATVTKLISITETIAPRSACLVGSNDLTPTYDITRVVLNTIDNPNPNTSNGYTDYTCDWSTNLTIGVLYDLRIEGYPFNEENVAVWIDLNNSGTFEDDELVFEIFQELSPHEDQIMIPISAAIIGVPLRMRVVCEAWNNVPTSCDNVGSGEFEDYTIIIEENTSPPVAGFNFDFINGCQRIIQFNDLSTNLPYAWSWDFGDGSTGSTLQNPIHVFPTQDTYLVTLTATNDFGSSTYSMEVNTNALSPTIEFTGVPEPNTAITFQAISLGATSWYWDFGDGGVASEESPTHQYADIGTYLVSLTVFDTDGCTADTTKQIAIVIDNVEELEGAISLFPNPTNGNISIKNTSDARYSEIQVVNSLGQILKEINTSNHIGDTYYLDLENFSSGMYVLRLKFANDQVLQRKFVLQ